MNSEEVSGEDPRLLALQALTFEMNWPTFKWIRSVFIRVTPQVVNLLVEYAESPSRDSEKACSAMFEEIFKVAYGDDGKRLVIDYKPRLAGAPEFRHLMTDEIFERLAREIAPWRLEAGR